MCIVINVFQSMYADLTAYMLMTQSSLDDLQSRVNDVHLNPKDFRPNIFVQGTLAYDEDKWKYLKIKMGTICTNI